MNSKMKRELMVVGIALASIVLMAASYFLGGIMSPLLVLILYVLGFNLVLLPIVINKYYQMYDSATPGIKSFIPLYNATLITSSGIAITSYFAIIANIIIGLLVANVWVFEFLGDKLFFTVSDVLPLVLMVSISVYYIVAGIGLMSPFIQIRDIYFEELRESDEIVSGFARFLMNTGNLTKYLEVLLLILPVFRIVPVYLSYCRVMELSRYNVSFTDYE